MAPSQTEIESQIMELAEKSFKTFCGDISDMFGMDMACNRKEVTHETVNALKTRFEDFAVVYSVRSEGALNGTFRMVFDRQGLFILAGVVAMQPGQMILEDITSGSLEKAEKTGNVLNEVGTALAGSWDRVFHKELDDHGRFVLTNTFIGNPWDNSEEKIGLNTNEELVFVPYDMTICPYPAFKCCAIFPKAIFAAASESGAEQPAPPEEKAPQDTEESTEPQESPAAEQPQPQAEEPAEPGEGAAAEQPQPQAQETVEAGESPAAEQPQPESQGTAESGEGPAAEPQPEAQESTEPQESPAAEQPQPEAQESTEPQESPAAEQPQPEAQESTEPQESPAAEQPQPEAEEAAAAEEGAVKQEPESAGRQESGDVEGQTATISETDIVQERPISDAIKKMAESAAGLPGESVPSSMAEKPGGEDALATVCAKDIMQKEVVWAKPEDTVQQALSMMQQYNTGYIVVGPDQVPEGIVSNSDLNAALSPYLRNIFAKWRRPLDDATLKIKIKWIMSRPTCTVSPQTSLVKIMENMCRTEKKCLPVVDDKGKVRGLVTVFDIFRALIKYSCPP